MHIFKTETMNYCSFAKRIFKEISFISFHKILGVPKIVSTKNSRRKAFKIISFFLGVAGFLWQTHTFLEIYLDYPVVQHVTTEEPEVFMAPAVTLCNRNR